MTVKTINGINYYYTKFYQTKKNGKRREINAPCINLKQKQHHLKSLLESDIESILPDYIVGFRANYNLKINGDKHLGKKWVINLDIKDFFPSINKEMLNNELNCFETKLKDHGYIFNDFIEFVTLNSALPQGSPISPLLSNYIGYKLIDRNVYPYLLKNLGNNFAYSRYADDVTISVNCFNTRKEVQDFATTIVKLIESNGFFKINQKKVNIMHRSQKQIVTGVTVNNKCSLGKKEKLKYRAIVHQLQADKIKMTDVLQGKLAYLKSVDPDYYHKLTKEI